MKKNYPWLFKLRDSQLSTESSLNQGNQFEWKDDVFRDPDYLAIIQTLHKGSH